MYSIKVVTFDAWRIKDDGGCLPENERGLKAGQGRVWWDDGGQGEEGEEGMLNSWGLMESC